MLQLVCSNKPRPTIHGGRPSGFYKTGACLWGRDVHHVRGANGNTLCGRNSSEWLTLDVKQTSDEMLKDENLCKRCAAKLNNY